MVQPVAVTTTLTLKGFALRDYKGIVPGSVVRFPTLVQGLFGGLKSIVGGRIGAASEMGEQARRQAYGQMISPARKLGANRIVGTRYDGSDGGGRQRRRHRGGGAAGGQGIGLPLLSTGG